MTTDEAANIDQRRQQVTLIQDTKGVGTGLVVGEDGWILTNKHVAPSVGPFRIITATGKDVRGVGIHQSRHYDLAVVKVAVKTPDFLDLESEVHEDFRVGDVVFAVGHPRGCRFTVTRGIISNPYREMDKEHFIQTDVSINPGNSGGPLLAADGKLVGVVSMMLSAAHGLGFAVPGYTAADYVRHVRRLVRQGVIRIPDELLDDGNEQPGGEIVVRDAVTVLCETGKASIEDENSEEGSFTLLAKKRNIKVQCTAGRFSAQSLITQLGTAERTNPKLLAELLELNGTGELGGASLFLDDTGLHVGVYRSTAGLDELEAVSALDNVVLQATQLPERIGASVYGVPAMPTPPAAIPPPAAVPPAAPEAASAPPGPQPPPPPTGDPGYPLIKLPE